MGSSPSPQTPPPDKSPSNWGRPFVVIVALLAIAAGLLFRFFELDRKFFWIDETHTAACVAGRSVHEVEALFDGRPRPLADLQSLQHLSSDSPLAATPTAVATTPEHTPVYYLLLRAWAGLFGDSPAALRSLSAVVNLLTLPIVWWLCRELGGSRSFAAVAIAWWSLSPFFVVYSQEARGYTLLAAIVTVAHLALLRAVRLSTAAAWSLYAATICLGYYTHLFMALTSFAHAVYIGLGLAGSGDAINLRKQRLCFALASAAAVLLFSPWLVLLARHDRHELLAGLLAERMAMSILLQSWVQGLAVIFADFGLYGPYHIYISGVAVAATFVILLAWCWFLLLRDAPTRVSAFLTTTALIPPLVLVAVDLATGSERSRVIRYWLPGLVTMGLIPCYVLGSRIASGSRVAAGIVVAWCLATAAADLRIVRHETWWNRGGIVGTLGFFIEELHRLRGVFKQMDAFPRPILLVEFDQIKSFELLMMSRQASDKLEWIGLRVDDPFTPPDDATFVLYHSDELKERLESAGYRFESLEATDKFWHCIPPQLGEAAGRPEPPAR